MKNEDIFQYYRIQEIKFQIISSIFLFLLNFFVHDIYVFHINFHKS